MKVSVIVCGYTLRRWDLLVGCIESVVTQEPAPDEVIVVTDHAPDLAARFEEAELGPEVRVIPNQGPRGVAAARNTGVASARGDVVVFIDDDAMAEPGWLAALLRPYADPAVVACGGAAEPAFQGTAPSWLPDEFRWVVGCTYRGMPEHLAPVRNLFGANMSVRRTTLLDAGGFPDGIGRVGTVPVGCEETYLCIRMSQEDPGARIMYEPRARVHHAVPPARATWRYLLSRCYAEGRSKALISSRLGAARALSTERSYAVRVLPAGVLRGLRDLLRGDPWGAARAAAIVVGLAATTAGYVRGRSNPPVGRAQPTEVAA